MIYRTFKDKQLSMLGLGMMRLPVVDGRNGCIDEAATQHIVDEAIARGVNYFDTAWGYHDGASETVTGKVLAKYPRESYYLASKFPGYDVNNMDKVEAIFEKQLEKCGVDHFDFYLVHNVCEHNVDKYLDPQYGVVDYLIRQRAAGRIKHLGFSAHGRYPTLEKFLNAYGAEMEFCQLQLNYLDWNFQQAKEKVELMEQWGLPVWVMEPLRGGKLATLAAEDAAILRAQRPDETVPGWAFRFLQTLPQVTMVLSGMSNVEQLLQNVQTFAEEKPLNKSELDALQQVAENIIRRNALPCTACRYCTTHCPQQLDIPFLLSLYNEAAYADSALLPGRALELEPAEKLPSACIGCRSCEAVCPQEIKIADALEKFSAMLGR